MTNSCKNCKHWNTKESNSIWFRPNGVDMGTCDATPMLSEATEWSEDQSDYVEWEDSSRKLTDEYANTKAFVMDGSDYRADLITTSEFYCNQWEVGNNV